MKASDTNDIINDIISDIIEHVCQKPYGLLVYVDEVFGKIDEIRGWNLSSAVCLFDSLEVGLYRSFGRNNLYETNIDKDQWHLTTRKMIHISACDLKLHVGQKCY